MRPPLRDSTCRMFHHLVTRSRASLRRDGRAPHSRMALWSPTRGYANSLRAPAPVSSALVSEAAFLSCTPSCLCMLRSRIFGDAAPPPAPTQPFTCHAAPRGFARLIGRPSEKLPVPPACSMLCPHRPSFLAPPSTAPPTGIANRAVFHHTTSHGCIPAAGSGSRHVSIFTFNSLYCGA
jgi:hypothetical protein